MVSRLRKNCMIKKSSIYHYLDSFSLKSGDSINFEIKILANRPWFDITQDQQFTTSSYYDGPDLERAMDIYTELLLAFKGAAKADEFRKSQPNLMVKIKKIIKEQKNLIIDDVYDNFTLKSKPLFLGINDF